MKKSVRYTAAAAVIVFLTGYGQELLAANDTLGEHTRERECTCRFIPRSSRYN